MLAGADLSRTVGWFTTMFPVRLAGGDHLDEVLAGGAAAGAVVKAVKEQLRGGAGQGHRLRIVAVSEHDTAAVLAAVGHAAGRFNYLGR